MAIASPSPYRMRSKRQAGALRGGPEIVGIRRVAVAPRPRGGDAEAGDLLLKTGQAHRHVTTLRGTGAAGRGVDDAAIRSFPPAPVAPPVPLSTPPLAPPNRCDHRFAPPVPGRPPELVAPRRRYFRPNQCDRRCCRAAGFRLAARAGHSSVGAAPPEPLRPPVLLAPPVPGWPPELVAPPARSDHCLRSPWSLLRRTCLRLPRLRFPWKLPGVTRRTRSARNRECCNRCTQEAA